MENLKHKKEQTLHPSAIYPPPWMQYPVFEEDEINLLDYWLVIKKRLFFIFSFCVLCSVAALFYVQYATKEFKVVATLTPLSAGSGSGLGAIASQLGSLPLIGGQLGGLAGNASKGAQLINIINSRSFLEKMVKDYSLLNVFYAGSFESKDNSKKPTVESAVLILQGLLKAEEEKKTTLINVVVTHPDPILATALINRIIVELQNTLNNKELTVAKRNRVFIEGQLQKNKIELLELGKRLNQFYGSGRVSSVSPQMDVDIGLNRGSENVLKSSGDLEAELQGLNNEHASLQQNLEKEEKNIVHNVPSQIYLQYLTLQRELLGKVYLLLSQQYEMAKVEEAKDDLRFQVIDPAYPPVKYDKPKKVIVLGVAAVASFFLAIFLAFFMEFVSKQKESVKS